MIECGIRRSSQGYPFGFEDLPVRVSGEYVREVRRKKAGPWEFQPMATPYELDKLVTWDVIRAETADLATSTLPEWELGWRPAVEVSIFLNGR